jgi:hypothetical protein
MHGGGQMINPKVDVFPKAFSQPHLGLRLSSTDGALPAVSYLNGATAVLLSLRCGKIHVRIYPKTKTEVG